MMLKEVIIIFVGIVFVSCGLPVSKYGGENKNDKEDLIPVKIKEESILFKKNNEKESLNEYFFETNDCYFLTSEGYTLWTTPYENAGDKFNSLSIKVRKESGKNNAGYGIVFCRQEVEEKTFMLCVLIDTKRHYIIGEVSEGKFHEIIEWTNSDFLKAGYGVNNTIRIECDNEKKEFTLYLNDNKEKIFKVDKQIKIENCRYGYVVVISDTENFPNVPVKVVFEKE